jgi:myo-inositol-1(or 4)-monophosphatase
VTAASAAGTEIDLLWQAAEGACRRGAEVVSRAQAGREPGAERETERKGRGDYVTAVDQESERAVRDYLAEATPAIPVLGEEGGGDTGDRYWAVDPLDGTTNFLIGFPAWAVSVGLVENGRPAVGVVRSPELGAMFSGARGRGAWSGRRRLAVSHRPAERAIVATGFPFRRRDRWQEHASVFRGVFDRTEDVRRTGSAALDLAWVAAGVLDGYFELGLQTWDLAAGGLLVTEAGGLVTGWDGDDGYLESGDVMAGSAATHAAMRRAAAEAAHET